MEFILDFFHRVQAAEGRGRFAEGFSPRKLAEALPVKPSYNCFDAMGCLSELLVTVYTLFLFQGFVLLP